MAYRNFLSALRSKISHYTKRISEEKLTTEGGRRGRRRRSTREERHHTEMMPRRRRPRDYPGVHSSRLPELNGKPAAAAARFLGTLSPHPLFSLSLSHSPAPLLGMRTYTTMVYVCEQPKETFIAPRLRDF